MPSVWNATPVRKLKASPFWLRDETSNFDEYWVSPLGVPAWPRLSVKPVPPKFAAPSFSVRPAAPPSVLGAPAAIVPLLLKVTSAAAGMALPAVSAAPLINSGSGVLVAWGPVASIVMLLIVATHWFATPVRENSKVRLLATPRLS